ncbi:MAG TPA: choice-of-anchor tandem repeat GloVer-containing protein [Terriglobales bacterium]
MPNNVSMPEVSFVAVKQRTKYLRVQHIFSASIFMLVLALTMSVNAQTFKVLHEFNGQTDGALPEGALLRDAGGNLFGTTFAGSPIGEGTVFKIDSAGKETVVFSFDAFVSGSNPASALIQDQSGNLIGTADSGPGGAGIVFRVSQQGAETLLHSFQGGTGRNARVPSGGPIMDKAGNILGTTVFGGNGPCQFGCGSIYRLDTAGTLRVLHNFNGGSEGSLPFGPLVRDAAGNLFGVAKAGGDLACPEFPQIGCGTVFKLSKGVLTVLHTFHGGTDGATPQPGLLLDAAGNLMGAAAAGGNGGNGLVFKISADGTYTVLHRFATSEGKTPNGSLVLDAAGNLFGTAQGGGVQGLGTVYRLNAAGRVTVLHAFTGDLDGAFPLAGLIRDPAGNLFGTAVKNFLINQFNGTVFQVTP